LARWQRPPCRQSRGDGGQCAVVSRSRRVRAGWIMRPPARAQRRQSWRRRSAALAIVTRHVG
jgi:hypothetical protein